MTAVVSATKADVPDLAELHRRIFGPQGPDPREDLQKMCESGLLLCVRADDRAIGLAVGKVAADELEIYSVGVEPSARREGLGRRLVAALEGAARTAGATRAFLEVRASNRAAQRLYAEAGYTASGRRPAYYRDGEDAVLMTRCLEPVCGD